MALPEPFGNLMFLIVSVVFLAIGIKIIIADKKSKKGVLQGIGVIFAPWILLFTLFSPVIDEWNPMLEADSAAWGIWEGDGYFIELKSDSTFIYTYEDESMSGTWRRVDFKVHLTTQEGRELYVRFVKDSGVLLLLPDPPRDESPQPGPITKKRL
jgi:hypothetical protein